MVPPPNKLCGNPGLGLVPDQALHPKLGPAALKSSPTEAINVEHFLGLCLVALPNLVGCARRYVYATVSSADAENSFSYTTLCYLRGDGIYRSTNKEDEDEGSPVDDVGVETDDESDVNFDVEEG
ncbi:hypothetical protein PoB_001340600 [Plakobranchus ocellatus]|uniref:Uncharacterized protein n=1 Tax=Plakobranchus ocellatus TaxID=259542 RepID=A0AAV3YHZ6_9GAST|nr:hypothetical protein PoB_001340600 [Plakobranchus ocellatus]